MNTKTTSNRSVGIGLIGLGTVGSGVAKILLGQSRSLEKKIGVGLSLRKVAVRSLSKKRRVAVPRRLFTRRADAVVRDPSVQIVVELIGGIQPAKKFILEAFRRGKHVVTANKALLAEQGSEIFGAAEKYSRRLGIEASVCGGIPIIKALNEGLASNEITQIFGIVNGTCNNILTSMSQGPVTFAQALKQAQLGGYAEKNPSLDIDGIDSAHKLAILARLAFRSEIPFKAIHVEGIRGLAKADMDYAKELGYVIKLLAIGKKTEEGLELRVHPTLLPLDHPLATVRGVYNAVFLNGDQTRDLLFYGKGAGMMPTASAVMSDIIDIAKRAPVDRQKKRRSKSLSRYPILPIGRVRSMYYLRFQVKDRPGVLGAIAKTLGQHHISILSVHQKESHNPDSVPVIILTYEACEKNLRAALKTIDSRSQVSRKTVVLRVEK